MSVGFRVFGDGGDTHEAATHKNNRGKQCFYLGVGENGGKPRLYTNGSKKKEGTYLVRPATERTRTNRKEEQLFKTYFYRKEQPHPKYPKKASKEREGKKNKCCMSWAAAFLCSNGSERDPIADDRTPPRKRRAAPLHILNPRHTNTPPFTPQSTQSRGRRLPNQHP